MLFNLPIGFVIVKHYPYRTAQGRDLVFQIDASHSNYKLDREFKRLHNELAAAAGVRVDNHEVYAVKGDGPQTFYYWFSDWKLYVCLGVYERSW